ncbi:MAG: hypothetical protein JNK15_21080, partial [Planctomycetes bacterium]|nr:hypothetical protein [Planctomycetota bacterium]
RDNWLFTADQFEAWADEPVVAVTAQGYVDFDPAGVETLCQPRTGALVARANAWFAFAGQDPDYVRCRRTAEVAAFTQSLVEQQAKAHQKLLPVAQAVVDGFGSLEIADERVRGRLQNFADWDLPLLLQNHPAQHAMVDRVHDLLDAHDAKTLGAEAALRLRREQALTAADALWSRMQQWVPLQGGFEPVQAELFVGKLMRLEGVWLRSGEFDAPGHDFAFDLGGRTFVADLTTGLRDALRLARTRLQLGDPQRLAADEACELMAVVGAETEVKLLGGKGKDDALAVPARVVHVIGLRQGAVFAMRP